MPQVWVRYRQHVVDVCHDTIVQMKEDNGSKFPELVQDLVPLLTQKAPLSGSREGDSRPEAGGGITRS